MGSGSSSVDEDSEVTMYQNVKRNSTYQVVALGVLDKETQTLRLCQSLLISGSSYEADNAMQDENSSNLKNLCSRKKRQWLMHDL
ncbi:hypothetical protein ACET3Z_011054 [Daucus carota]